MVGFERRETVLDWCVYAKLLAPAALGRIVAHVPAVLLGFRGSLALAVSR